MTSGGFYQHSHPRVKKGVHGRVEELARGGRRLVSHRGSGRLVVQIRGSWVMQMREVKTVRDTVARKNSGNCNSSKGRKDGLGVTNRKWWLHATMGGRRETLPLNGGSVGMRDVSGGGCAETRLPPCRGLDSTDTSEGFEGVNEMTRKHGENHGPVEVETVRD